jgi:hypothetical protein
MGEGSPLKIPQHNPEPGRLFEGGEGSPHYENTLLNWRILNHKYLWACPSPPVGGRVRLLADARKKSFTTYFLFTEKREKPRTRYGENPVVGEDCFHDIADD